MSTPIEFLGIPFDEAAVRGVRSVYFGGFLSMGGLMLASLTFITTRLHHFEASEGARERRARIEYLRPRAPHAITPRSRAISTLRVVLVCFLVALLQVTVGLLDDATYPWAKWVCLMSGWLGVLVVAHGATRSIRTYMKQLDKYEQDLQEEARRRLAS